MAIQHVSKGKRIVKKVLFRSSLTALLIGGLVFEKWYVAHLAPCWPNQPHFDSYVDIRDWRGSQISVLGEWVTMDAVNDKKVIARQTIISGPVGDCIWLPVPAWLGIVLLNTYWLIAIALIILLLRDFTHWHKRRRTPA